MKRFLGTPHSSKLIDRYILSKYLKTFLLALSLICVIVITFDVSEKMDDFLGKHAPFNEIVFDYYLNFIPGFVNLYSPLFIFISVIFFTSKMAGNTEIIAILGSGISYKRLLRPYIYGSCIVALIVLVLGNFVIPYSNRYLVEFDNKYIHTWLNLAEIKDQASWFATNNKYYNVGTYNGVQRQLKIDNLFFTENLVFQSDSASGNTVVVDADTDLGIGYLQFKRAEGAPEGQTVAFTLQSAANNLGRNYMVNSAGFVVEKGVDLHVKLTNTERVDGDYYYREWRKVGDGDLYLEGQGDNGIFLNVGGSGTTYLREDGGYAAYNVLINNGATLDFGSDVTQIARDVTFGNGGGYLEFSGLSSFDWKSGVNDKVEADGFTINALTQDAILINSKDSTTLRYLNTGNTTFLGSFQDTENSSLTVINEGGGTWTLQSIHTNLQNENSRFIAAASGRDGLKVFVAEFHGNVGDFVHIFAELFKGNSQTGFCGYSIRILQLGAGPESLKQICIVFH